jgi:hypothetical protein
MTMNTASASQRAGTCGRIFWSPGGWMTALRRHDRRHPDEARDLAAQKRLEMRRGTWRGRQRGRLSFNAWATEWWETWAADDPSPTSLASAESRLRLRLRLDGSHRPGSVPVRCGASPVDLLARSPEFRGQIQGGGLPFRPMDVPS